MARRRPFLSGVTTTLRPSHDDDNVLVNGTIIDYKR